MEIPAIELKNVWVKYDQGAVLSDVSLSVPGGVFLGVIGPNGGGKTTFLKALLGLVTPAKGSVRIFGAPPVDARKWIGYVPQRSLIDREFPVRVWEVALMGRLTHAGLFRRFTDEDRASALSALKQVGMLKHRDRQIGELSEGERQRVFVARALVANPRILLLDEPTASIDKPMETNVYELLSDLKNQFTIVMVSHDIGAVASYVDKIACLNNRLYFHDSKEVSKADLEAAYGCPIDLIGHGLPHRVVAKHGHEKH